MKKRLSKIFAVMLLVCMIFTAFPATAFAADEEYAAPGIKDHLPWYYYNDMTEKEQEWYLILRKAVMNRQKDIEFTGLQMTEEFLNKANFILMYSDSLIFDYTGYTGEVLRNRSTGKIKQYDLELQYWDYAMSVKNYNKAVTLIDQKIDKIIDAMDEDLNTREKIVTFHDYLIKNVTYDLEYKYAHTPYGALITKTAVCDGFAYAFQYFCEEVGIPCVIVTGDTNDPNLGHAWNKVKLGNNWYVVDITNDNDDVNYPKFAPKTFLFLADKEYKAAREINEPGLNEPKATDDTKSYYELVGASFTDYDSALGYVIKKAKLNTFIAVQITNKNAFDKFLRDIGEDVYDSGVFGKKRALSWLTWYFDYNSGTIIVKFYQD